MYNFYLYYNLKVTTITTITTFDWIILFSVVFFYFNAIFYNVITITYLKK